MKKIVTVQDVSCFGKCSLTVALPIISAMGIETAVIPTAVLSTHTGGFSGYTFHDLSGDITAISDHWKRLGLKFDAIYTGYLGSSSQVQIMSEFFDNFGTAENFIVVDPVLGDSGRLYAEITTDFVSEMRKLCLKADYILPNMTEAAFLLDIPYIERCDEEAAKKVMKNLAELGCRTPVLTGIRKGNSEGAGAFDSENNQFFFSYAEHRERHFHGTGDIFASVFTGAVTLEKSLQSALDISVKYISDCIECTMPEVEEMWYGSCFELCLDRLIEYTK